MRMQLSKTDRNVCFSDQVHDLDVTPVMNMFIILIPFLISMAVFTRLSILSFSLPPDAAPGLDQSNGKPKLKLTVVVASEYLAIAHGEQVLDSIPVNDKTSSYVVLMEKISERRVAIDNKSEVVVAVKDSVKFQEMVKVMDVCREAGFQKIGISTASINYRKGV